jgi:hypothetical protein
MGGYPLLLRPVFSRPLLPTRRRPPAPHHILLRIEQRLPHLRDLLVRVVDAAVREGAAFSLRNEALIPYLKGEKPVVLGAYDGHDVRQWGESEARLWHSQSAAFDTDG